MIQVEALVATFLIVLHKTASNGSDDVEILDFDAINGPVAAALVDAEEAKTGMLVTCSTSKIWFPIKILQ